MFSVINNLITKVIDSLLRRKQILNLSLAPELKRNISIFKYEEWKSTTFIRIFFIFKYKFKFRSTYNYSPFLAFFFFFSVLG